MAWGNGYGGYGYYPPYVSVAERRKNAARELAKMKKKGREVSPVKVEGRTIAKTFWGSAWCENLEAYSDLASRLPRGRTYVRNGSVLDLQISAGKINALVMGSELYKIEVAIAPVKPASWKSIARECVGKIDSLVELLSGKLSGGVMEIMTRKGTAGLFPTPGQISMECSCPDYAGMCKHIAATLYGVGARLDEKPELLFVLRKVDHAELIAHAGKAPVARRRPAAKEKVLATDDLAGIFGIELDGAGTGGAAGREKPTPSPHARKKAKGRRA